ncbi:CRPV-167 [Crowpox virus]|nr:CRPV-167 [Crowpox virus]
MFRNYKYQSLKDNDYEEEILIPGLYDDDETIGKDNKTSFEKQVLDIVRNNYKNNYKNLMLVSTKYNNTSNITELLYKIISSDSTKKYTFNINYYDNIFGLYNKLHEFIYKKKVKILYDKNFISMMFIRDNVSLKIDIECDVEGQLMDIKYKIEFDDVIKLQISGAEIIIIDKLIYLKNKIFIFCDDYKIVSNENDFLLEIENVKN